MNDGNLTLTNYVKGVNHLKRKLIDFFNSKLNHKETLLLSVTQWSIKVHVVSMI